jgi:hypothetical protein
MHPAEHPAKNKSTQNICDVTSGLSFQTHFGYELPSRSEKQEEAPLSYLPFHHFTISTATTAASASVSAYTSVFGPPDLLEEWP